MLGFSHTDFEALEPHVCIPFPDPACTRLSSLRSSLAAWLVLVEFLFLRESHHLLSP